LSQLDLEIGIVDHSGVTVFELSGELDAYTSEQFREAILSRIDAGLRLAVVDFLKVEYIDSSGLGAMVAALKRTSERNGRIYVVCGESQVLKVLRITGLEKVFPVFPDRDAAMEAIRKHDAESLASEAR
jgi:anti-sigma B factor antagonist